MRELHQLTPLWTQMKRRIIGVRDVTQQMADHPFFVKIGMVEPVRGYLGTVLSTLEDHLSRLTGLKDETNVLISLVSPFLCFVVDVVQSSLRPDIQYFHAPRHSGGDGRGSSC